MHLTLNIDLVRWIDANRAEKSRAAFITLKLKELMQDTTANAAFHTKGYSNDNYTETHLPNGVDHTPEQV